MRISLILTALVAAPLLLAVTACENTTDNPKNGRVIDKEYEAAKHCPRTKATSRKACVPKSECYELDILLTTGEVVEVCDKDAFLVLTVGEPYDSSRDYSGETR